MSHQFRGFVGREHVRGVLPDEPIPALRAGYLTTHGDMALAEASQRLAVKVVGGRADGFRGKSAGAVVVRSDGARFWLKVSGLVGRANHRPREDYVVTATVTAVSLQQPRSQCCSSRQSRE